MSENHPSAVAAMQGAQPDLVSENADLRRRLAALEKQQVVQGTFAGEVPRYRLNEKGFYDDTLYEAGTVIDYIDPPNLTMVPINDAARERMNAEIAHLTSCGQEVAAMKGRHFPGLVSDRNVLVDLLRADAEAAARAPVPVIQMPTPYNQPPAMPHLAEAQTAERRGPGRPRKASAVSGPPAPVDRGAPMLAPTADAVVGRRVA